MTVSSAIAKTVHVTHEAVTNYSFGFKVFNDNELSVLIVDQAFLITPLVLGQDYIINGLGQDHGGTVSLTAAGRDKAGSGLDLVLLRQMSFVQETDYSPHDVFPAESHERALDILTMICQELREMMGRALIAPPNLDEPIDYAAFAGLHAAVKAGLARAREEADRAGSEADQSRAAKTQARCAVTAAKKWAAFALKYSAEAARAAVEAVEAGSKIVPMTEEEYEALCPEEKMSGKWFVIYTVVIGAAASLKILKLTHLGKDYELGPDIEIPTATPATETEPGSDDMAATGSQHWESGWFNIALNGSYNHNHDLNLAVERQSIRIAYKMIRTVGGYAVGDIFYADRDTGFDSGYNMGFTFVATANSVLLSVGNGGGVISTRKGGGSGGAAHADLQIKIIIEGVDA